MSTNKADQKVHEAMKLLADKLDEVLEEVAGTHMLFTLMVYSVEEGAKVNYVSNANRDDVKGAMKSMIIKWEEGNIPAPSNATKH